MKYRRENIDSDTFKKKGKRKVAEDFTTNVKEDKATLILRLKLKAKEMDAWRLNGEEIIGII